LNVPTRAQQLGLLIVASVFIVYVLVRIGVLSAVR